MKNYEIQRIRAIALICILIGHLPFATSKYLIHGYSWVSLFLIITGYFSVQSLVRHNNSESRLSVIKSEFIKRFFRLFPLMYIWILIYFFISWTTVFLGGTYGDWSRWQNELMHSLNLTYNYYLARLSIGGLFGQYWTLFIEIHFSIFFILLFGIVRNMQIRQYLSIVFILLTVFCFRPLTPAGEVKYVTHAHLDALFAGVLIALFEDKRNGNSDNNNNNTHKYIISIVLCLVMLLSAYFFDTYYNKMNIKYTFYTVVGCLIFILAKENNGWFNFGKVINRFLDFAGDASASTYVSHNYFIFMCLS